MPIGSNHDEGILMPFILDAKGLPAEVSEIQLPFVDVEKQEPTKYWHWENFDDNHFSYTDLALRIRSDDVCTMTFRVRQMSKFYTYTRNRTSWTGPTPSLVLLDRGSVPIGDVFYLRQINRFCGQHDDDERIVESKKINHAFSLTVTCSLSFSAYRTWPC